MAIVPRICAMPDVPVYTIKQMQAITVRFASNPGKENSGAIAGYATYKQGTLSFTVECNLVIEGNKKKTLFYNGCSK